MRIALPIVSLLVAGTLVGCGGSDGGSDDSRDAATSPPAATETREAPSPTISATPDAPTYEILERSGLEGALLELNQLPPGYSQDPPTDDSDDKTFCDYKEPADEKVRVRRDFSKGEDALVSLSLREYGSVSDASLAWDALTEALKTCKGESYEGSDLTYTLMSAPTLGDGSLGLKIEVDGFTLLQNFVLVGPVMVSTGGAGTIDADAVAALLETQVERYVDAATAE